MLKARQSFNVGNREPQQCGSSCLPGIPESVLLDFFDAEPLHVWLAQAEELDEVGAIYIAYILGLDRVVLPTSLVMILKCFDMVVEFELKSYRSAASSQRVKMRRTLLRLRSISTKAGSIRSEMYSR